MTSDPFMRALRAERACEARGLRRDAIMRAVVVGALVALLATAGALRLCEALTPPPAAGDHSSAP